MFFRFIIRDKQKIEILLYILNSKTIQNNIKWTLQFIKTLNYNYLLLIKI